MKVTITSHERARESDAKMTNELRKIPHRTQLRVIRSQLLANNK